MNWLYWLVALLFVAIGVAGVLLPAIPGSAAVLIGIFIAAWIDDFQRIGLPTLLVECGLALLTGAVDWVATALGAQRFGGSKWGAVGAILGLAVGFFFGLPGILVGPFVGAVALELGIARRDSRAALRAGLGTFVGFLLSTVVRYAIVLLMLGIAVLAWWL